MKNCQYEHGVTRKFLQKKGGYFVNDKEIVTQEQSGYLVCDDCGETIRMLSEKEL